MKKTSFIQPLLVSAFSLFATGLHAQMPKIKALIIDGQNNHKWKETAPVLRQILENSGVFTVEVSTSPP